MSMIVSYITLEVPLDNGTTMSIRSKYKDFLTKGIKELKRKSGAELPLTEEMMVKLMDSIISTCAKASTVFPTGDDEPEEEKPDEW